MFSLTQLKRSAGIYLLAPCVPLLSWAVALFVNADGVRAVGFVASLRASLAAEALLYVAGAVVVAAPLAGVMVGASQAKSASRTSGTSAALAAIRQLTIAVLLLATSSFLLMAAALGPRDATSVTFIATSHATLGAVALALAAFGALCGASFADELDAAACAVLLAVLTGGGLLVAGAAVGQLPRPMIDAALAASPFVAITSAAHIDIIRTDALYSISPLAHLQVKYPAWDAACGWYLGVALLCFLGLRWRLDARPASPAHAH